MKRNSLRRKLLRYALIGLLAAFTVFVLSAVFCGKLLNDHYSGSSDVSDAFEADRKDFQKYVTENQIKATDVPEIMDWVKDKHFARFLITREVNNKRYLLYDDSFDENVVLDYAYSDTVGWNWVHFKEVQFADGAAKIYIDKGSTLRFYILTYLACAGLAILTWAILFSFFLRRELNEIRKLDGIIRELGAGDMDVDISVRGSTEVQHLGAGLNWMRNEILKREDSENRLKDIQKRMVLGLSHDLRNPITGVVNYIELAKVEEEKAKRDIFLQHALQTVFQVRDLSDSLFEYFLTEAEEEIELEEAEPVIDVLEDYLSDMVMNLGKFGLQVNAEGLTWPDVKIRVNHTYLGRIFQNLISNMKKYADPTCPVFFIDKVEGEDYLLILRNTPKENAETTVKGTKLGVRNNIAMMRNMKCRCEIDSTVAWYETKFYFPINEDTARGSVTVPAFCHKDHNYELF